MSDSPETPDRKEKKLSEIDKRLKKFPSFRIALDSDCFLVQTCDLNVAAYLKVIGYEIVDLRPKGDRKTMEMWLKCKDQENPQSAAQDIVDFLNNRGQAGRYLEFSNARGDLIVTLRHF